MPPESFPIQPQSEPLAPDAIVSVPSAGDERLGRGKRMAFAWLVVLAAACLLGVAASLEASPDGVGTHRQLSLPACGWISSMDLPCFTCGMTTAFAHAANGDLRASFLTQPAGCLLAVAAAMALLLGVHAGITGANPLRAMAPLWGSRTPWIIGGVLLAAWVFKIARHKGVV